MPLIRSNEIDRHDEAPVWRLQEVEKKGVMCTVCKKVHWGFVNVGQLNRCRKCGNTEFARFINVSSADFNKYSGRCLREDELLKKRAGGEIKGEKDKEKRASVSELALATYGL